MPSGVGMTDIAIGKALRTGLVRQIAVRARDHAGGEYLPPNLRRFCYRAQIPADSAAAFMLEAVTAIWESVGAFPSLRIDAFVCSRPE